MLQLIVHWVLESLLDREILILGTKLLLLILWIGVYPLRLLEHVHILRLLVLTEIHAAELWAHLRWETEGLLWHQPQMLVLLSVAVVHTELVSWLQYIIILSHPGICLVGTAFGRLQITVIVGFLHWGLLSWFRQRRRLLQSALAFGVAALSICVVLSMVESMAVLLVMDHIDVIILLLLMKRLSKTNKILKEWVHRQLCYMAPFLHVEL